MSLIELPTEILMIIVANLSIIDILSCSRVNLRWRYVLNDNKLWEKLYLKSFVLNAKYPCLLERLPLVNQSFEFPKRVSENLVDICEWKRRYMQKGCVMKNWRQGKYVSFKFPDIKFNSIQFEDDLIVFLSQTEHMFSVFDIKKMPEFLQKLPLGMNKIVSFFKLSEGKLVSCQGRVVEVFSRNERCNEFKLTHRFLFDRIEEDARGMPQTGEITSWYKRNIEITGDYAVDFDHNGRCFVGLLTKKLDYAVLHIWNLATGNKTLEKTIPGDNITCCKVYLFPSDVYIREVKFDGSTTILCFDLNLAKFTDFKISCNEELEWMVFFDEYVIAVDLSYANVILWSRENGKLLHKVSCDFKILSEKSIQMIPSSSLLLLGGQDKSKQGKVKVFSLETLQTILDLTTGILISQLIILGLDLMMLHDASGKLEVWNILKNKKVCTLEVLAERIWVSNCLTRMVVRDLSRQHSLLHFW